MRVVVVVLRDLWHHVGVLGHGMMGHHHCVGIAQHVGCTGGRGHGLCRSYSRSSIARSRATIGRDHHGNHHHHLVEE